MSLEFTTPSHANTSYTATTTTSIQYTISYTYTRTDVNDTTSDITLVTAWQSPYTGNDFIDFSTVTQRVTSSNLNTYQTEIETKRQAQEEACKEYLNTLIGPVTLPSYTKSRDVTSDVNGITYEVITDYSIQNIGGYAENTYDTTSANINVAIKWKIKGSKFAYETYYDDTVLEVTAENYLHYNDDRTQVVTAVQNIIDNQMVPKLLNKLIGVVNKPGNVVSTFSSEDGKKTVYVRTTVSGFNSVQNATSCTLLCTTVAGVDEKYGMEHAVDVPFEIKADNYKDWEDRLAEYIATEQGNVKGTDFYRMLSIAIPAQIKRTNYTANNGLVYNYTITCKQDTVTVNSNKIDYVTVITTNSYTQTYSSKSVTFDLYDDYYHYSHANVVLSTVLADEERDLKEYLDTLNFTTINKVKVTTDYGFDTNYGNQLDTFTYNIVFNNYRSYSDNLLAIGDVQVQKIFDTEVYKMLNVAPPNNYTGTFIKNAATVGGVGNYGIVYFYKVEFDQSGSTPASHTLAYTIKYGPNPLCETIYESGTITFGIDDYNEKLDTFIAEVDREVVDLQAYIRSLPNPEMPKQDTQAVIKLTTDYGLDTEYGNSLATSTYLVTATNYTVYENNLDDVTQEQEEKITGTKLHKMYDVVKPTNLYEIVVKDGDEFTYEDETYKTGIIYYYEVIFNQGATTGSTNEIQYQINYGSSKAYDNIFGSGSVVFNINDYDTAINSLLNEVQTKLGELENYIADVVIPEDHYKPTTSAIVRVESEFGLTTNYGTGLGNTPILIDAEHYKNYTKMLTDKMTEQEANINNIELFKMLDMELPDPIVKSYTPTSNGIKFDYKITPSFYKVSDTNFTIRCTTMWDQNGKYSKRYLDKDIEIALSERTSAYVKISTAMNEAKAAIEAYLDTILPFINSVDDYTQKINTLSGVQIWAKTTGHVVETDLDTKYTIKFTTTYDIDGRYRYTYSSNQTFEVTSNIYSNWSNRYAARVNEEQLKIKNLNVYKMLNINVPVEINKTHSANGKTYTYKILPLQGEADFNTNSFKYTVYWSQGSQENIFCTKTIVFTQTTYSSATADFANAFNAEESAISTYLNSLTFKQSQTVKLVTEYGLTTSYGTTLSTINHEIDAVHYKTYAKDLTDATTREQDTVKNTNAYHVLNIVKPADITSSKTAINGQKYYYRFRFTQSTTSLTGNKIDYVLEYGLNTNYGSTYTSGSFNFDVNNYVSASTTMENTSNQKIADLLRFFDNIIGVVTLPNTISNSWVTNSGKTMNVRTRFEIASSTVDSEVSSEKDSITVKYSTEYSLDSSYNYTWSNNKTYAITPNTYNGYSTALVNAAKLEQKALQDSNIMAMLNVERPISIEDNFVATNGIVYNYAAKFVQDEATIAKNKIVVVLWYGTSSNPNIVYSQTVKEFTPTNCANATAELTSAANTQITALKAFLNAYVPSDGIVIPNPETYVYTSKSGKKFYLKTTFTKGEHDDTKCVVRYITVWGFSNTYGNTFSDITYTITPSTYQDYTQTLIEKAHQEFEKCELAKFGIWDVILPNNSNETYTTKGKDTYYIKSTFEQGDTDNTSNTIEYTITYGTSLSTNTANLWSESTHTVTNNNVSNATTEIRNLANGEVARLEEFLESPNITLPNDTEVTHSVNGFKYNLQVIHSKGTKGNIVISTAKIDGNVFDSATTTTFLSQKDVTTTLENIVNTKMNAMIAKCDLSPVNKTEKHTIGDSEFTIDTEFVKNPGVVQAAVITKLDGVEYKRSLVNINANSIESNLNSITSTGETNANALKGVLSNMPVTNTSIHTSGGFNFSIKVTYTKAVNSNVVHYIIACDNSVYDSNDYLLDATVLTNTISDLTATVTSKANELKRKLTNASPTNSSEILTYNGFKYLVGVEYSKASTSKNATVKVVIDSVKFNEFSKLIDQSTIDNDMIVLVSKGDEIRASLLNLINQSPANKSYVHQVNGFNYTIGTNYDKTAGGQNVTVQTLLDGRVYKTITRTIEATHIGTNLNECILSASNNELELKTILNTSPANSNRSVFTVDDIKYYIGSTFVKTSNNAVVTVAITLDNEPVETYSENILAESVEADITRIKNGATTRVSTLKETLIGLKNTTATHTKNGFNFKLGVVYAKDLENHTLTISTKVDNVLYGTPYTTTFNKDNIEDYKIKANNLLENIKSVLNNVPADISNDYAVNGFNFKVGIAYEKAVDNATVRVYTVLDGVRFDDPKTINFNMDNIGLISEKGLSELAVLKERLNNVPANYSNIFTVGGLNFRISTNFVKAANSNIVTITTAVDGEDYGSATTKTFDINDISSISLETNTREEEIKDILRGAPEDSTEVYTIRRLNFNIQKIYQKSAGSKIVTSLVKMDGNQYEQDHQEEYNITNLASLTSYNDSLVASLKNKLTNSVPNDIHTTYTRNQFTFVVDIYFTKSVNSDVINVEYYIDSADLANTH